VFDSYDTAVRTLVSFDRTFEPDAARHEQYQARYAQYRRMWPLVAGFMRDVAA
jgi:hypothetical protein